MTLEFSFALVVFLGSAWIFLLDKVIAVTTEGPLNAGLIAFAVMHFYIFAYLFAAIVVFYRRGAAMVEKKANAEPGKWEVGLVKTWPAALVISVVCWAYVSFWTTKPAGTVLSVFALGTALIYAAPYLWSAIRERKHPVWRMMLRLVAYLALTPRFSRRLLSSTYLPCPWFVLEHQSRQRRSFTLREKA